MAQADFILNASGKNKYSFAVVLYFNSLIYSLILISGVAVLIVTLTHKLKLNVGPSLIIRHTLT